MGTEKPRIQAYLDVELYQDYIVWKLERRLSKDSEALNLLLAEYFGKDISSNQSPFEARIKEIEKEFNDFRIQFKFEVWSSMKREFALWNEQKAIFLEKRVEALEKILNARDESPSESPSNPLYASELAKRLNVNRSQISRRKDKEDFAEWSQAHDPEGWRWRYDSQERMYFSN